MKTFLQSYFGFNREQRNGLLVLLFVSFTLLIIRIVYPYSIEPDKNIVISNLPLYEKMLDEQSGENSSPSKTNLFVFNPNTVNYEQLLQLGFKEKTARTFLKYRSKGFVFKQKSDLQKVYGISPELYEKLEPYILIPNGKKSEGRNEKSEVAAKQQQKKLELNSADSLQLLELNGIGPSYAKRILKYRSILGGYVSVEQLKEVYGFTEELFDKVKPFVSVDSTLIKKIKINDDDFKTVNKHPYITYELCKTIFDWRRKSVITSTSLKDILNDDVLYNKLLPYLSFE